ncbi:AMP-binding protein [Nocardia sp. alder85J]|uniref:AMP-binding protein n=1 Tax=Nocardia sp. alder85J TaxID=2862949 RepID=UPI001CD681B0|nr:AMP-binding protein [Nocardia sp. alder85J]MCX4093112.1 AMP-binding protein [Nocardia sp. alder85J]
MTGRPQTLVELLEALRRSERTITFADSKVTLAHRELAGLAGPVGRRLRAAGAGPGELVGVLMPATPQWFAGFFGAVTTGAAVTVLPLPPLVLDPGTVAEHLVPIVRAGGIRLLVTANQGRKVARELAARVPGLTVLELDTLERDDEIDWQPADPDAPVVVQFSSGSTARPKGVRLTHAQFLSGVAAIDTHISTTADDVLVQWVPLFHDMGLVSLMCSLLTPNDAHLFSALTFVKNPGAVLRYTAEVGGTITNGPNFSFDKLIEAAGEVFGGEPGDRPLRRWRLALNGAEPVRAHTVREFARTFAPLGVPASTMYPCYGMAEATLAVTLPVPGAAPRVLTVDRDELVPGRPARPVPPDAPNARELVSVGVPIPGITVRICAFDGTPLPGGHVGEIRIQGPAVTSGYHGDDEITRAALVDGWLRTGDLGLLDGGELVIVGRVKEMIIVQGRNFYPDDVEEAVRVVPGVHKGHCVAVADTEGERMIVVAESEHESGTAAGDAVVAGISRAVSKALTLAAVVVLLVPAKALPRTTSGKWQRSLVAELARAHASTIESVDQKVSS